MHTNIDTMRPNMHRYTRTKIVRLRTRSDHGSAGPTAYAGADDGSAELPSDSRHARCRCMGRQSDALDGSARR
jgi:hypothetical protein